MATTDDLTRGHSHDTALAVIDQQLPDWATNEDPSTEMLALVLLDRHYGLNQSGDYVYITPGYLWAIMPFVVLEPSIARALQATEEGDLGKDEQLAADQRATREPFQLKLDYNPAMFGDEVPDADTLPEGLRGQILLVRVMTPADAQRLPAMITVRADGTPITLPTTRRPSHID